MRSIIPLHKLAIFLFFLLSFLIFINGNTFSQSLIKGRVTGRDGIALPAATIKVNATNITIADSSGHFTLNANPGEVIEVSFVGYYNRQIVLGNETDLNISLTETTVNLNDVVVIGYGTAKKKDLTGAVSSIAAKDFNKGIFSSPDQLIQGKASGVQIINNNGQPGGRYNS